MRWLRRTAVAGGLAAPVLAVVLVALPRGGAEPEVFRPLTVAVQIGPHEATVSITAQPGSFCLELQAPDRGAGNCAPALDGSSFVVPFGDGTGDAEFAVVAVAPPEAASVRIVPDAGEPVAGELLALDDRDEVLAVGYWSDPRPAPPPPTADVLAADGSVLVSVG